ncbi:MAG: SGNH/GDSL hydrolase family protein, partial [Acidobacteria bacterium]|nr:SGNH/GDSL hydrolase family protein [Acidobacteriota bacterium]
MTNLRRREFLISGAAAASLPAAPVAASLWNGFEQRHFEVEGAAGYVVLPRAAAAGKPWYWRARFPGFHPEAAIGLLSKGFHVAYYDLPNIFGSPRCTALWDSFYRHVTAQFGLSPKMALEGVSRGGLFVYNWAAKNPGKVNCIFCESPVCDLKSWPGGRMSGIGSPKDWQQALEAYGMTEEQMLAYRAAGGSITVHYNTTQPETSNGHHFPLDDPGMTVNFVLRHTPGMEHLAGSGLTPHGADFYKLRSGLRNSYLKFAAGGEARVAFLGGSITAMTGWRDLICEHLRKRFPKTKFDFVNAGMPSTGTTPGAFRLRQHALVNGPVDLLFEEAAVNDFSNEPVPANWVRGMEGIIRQARRLNPHMDVVVLYMAGAESIAAYTAGKTPGVIAAHEKVAAHYGAPSVDFARECAERIGAGEFTWEADFKSNVHAPPFGQELYTRAIVRMFDAAWRELPAPGTAAARHPVPAPIDPHSYFHGDLADIAKVQRGAGWDLVPSWRPTDKIATRPGFVDVPMLTGETPGAECKFLFEGTGVGLFVAAGPDAGVVEWSVDGGPFRSRDLFT